MYSERDRSATLSVSLPIWIIAKLDRLAEEMEHTRSRVLADILEDYITKRLPGELKALGADSDDPSLRRALRVLRKAANSP